MVRNLRRFELKTGFYGRDLLLSIRPTVLAVCVLFASCRAAEQKPRQDTQIYALKYAESEYPARLVNTRQAEGKVYMHWLVYLIRSADGSLTLIDCGFSDPVLIKRFGLRDFKPITEILKQLNIEPRQIQKVILTHTHFDHALDVELFGSATVYVHAREAEKPESPPLKRVFEKLAAQNRLQLVQNRMFVDDNLEAIHTAGHTRGSLVIRLQSESETTIFTGDECYFAKECHDGLGLPAAAAFDQKQNLAFIRSIKPSTRILTGHEPHKTGGRWITPQIFLLESVM
ncbi:MAG: N-acyl homoserine lactonase family protein [Turneriella sp.]